MATVVRLNDPLAAYPVGSIYMSVNSTSPETLFGGQWDQIQGRFLLACGSNAANSNNTTYGSCAAGTVNRSAGETGGEASHTLKSSESGNPELVHSASHTNPTVTMNNHTHGMSHTHGMQSHTHSMSNSDNRFLGYNYTAAGSSGVGEVRVTAASSGTNYVPRVKNSSVDFLGFAATGGPSNNTTTGASATSTGTQNVSTCTVSGGAVSVTKHSAADASSAHNNMPPYLAVYMWKRRA